MDDIASVAQLHRAAYGEMAHHLTAKFPPHMLEEYYSALLSDNPYSYIAFDDEQHPIGFIVAGFKVEASQRQFVGSHKRALIGLLILNPGILASRLARRLRRKQVTSSARLRLLSIAVDPSHHNRGTGKALLAYFEQQLRATGVHEYGLSVKTSNARAVRFYDNNGFELESEAEGAKYYKKHFL